MIRFLFFSILGVILFTCLVIVLLGCLWVLKVMLDELISDDALRTLERWAFNGGKTMGRLLQRRESRSKADRDREEVFEDSIPDGSDLTQEVQLSLDFIDEEVEPDRGEIQ